MFALLSLLTIACAAEPATYCAVDRDGERVAMVAPGAADTCGVFSFANLLNVQVLIGDKAWRVTAPYDDEEALDSRLSWDDGEHCKGVVARVTWANREPFDLTAEADCEGSMMTVRFYGAMP
jgi:hypothetical protein